MLACAATITAAGRDPDTLALSVARGTIVGRNDAEVRRRLQVYGREAEDIRVNAFAGTPAEVVDKLGAHAAAGADRAYLQLPDLTDLDHLDLIASDVLPHLA